MRQDSDAPVRGPTAKAPDREPPKPAGAVSGGVHVPATPTPETGNVVLDEAGLADARLTAALLAKSHRENFPVASRLLPQRLRQDLLALYGYARLVDDLGDEAPGDRDRLLDLVEADLLRIPTGEPRLPVVRTLADTVRGHDIPIEPFRRLIAANRQDQTVTRYSSYADLVDYCTLSANPVGHVVLHIFGRATPRRLALSDRVCTALQIAEHLQDVAEDLRRGRVYLPLEDLARFGCTQEDLTAPVASSRVRRLIGFERRRADALLADGAELVGTLSGLSRLAVAGYVAGGRAALAAVAEAGDDVLTRTPRPARARLMREWLWLLARGGVA